MQPLQVPDGGLLSLAPIDAIRPDRLRLLIAQVWQHGPRRDVEPVRIKARLGRLPYLEQQRRLVREEAEEKAPLRQYAEQQVGNSAYALYAGSEQATEAKR